MNKTIPLPLDETTALYSGDLPGLLDRSEEELRAWLTERGQPGWRARALRRWVLAGGAESFDAMTDVPKALRQELAAAFLPLVSRVARHLKASDGTHKLLVQLRDGHLVECVLIQEDARRTACISTQVGCGMGCVFCASGLNGVARNLTAAEILEQLIRLRNLPGIGSQGSEIRSREHSAPPLTKGGPGVGRADREPRPLAADESRSAPTPPGPPFVRGGEKQRLTHIVVMGMGEPLANLDNLLEALDGAVSKDGLGIGARHITISTVGLPAKIRRLADLGKQYHLAVSLHAPNDALRNTIVPTNNKTGLASILAAAAYFYAKTGRQVTFEYVLLRGLNDDAAHARELATLLAGRQAHVNIIPFNDVEGLPYQRPSADALAAFLEPLRQQGISVKVRKRKGSDIDAACGQLRRTVIGQ